MSLYGLTSIETVAQRAASIEERRLALLIAAAAIMLVLAIEPFQSLYTGWIPAFVPAAGSAIAITLGATATILRFRYRASRDASLAYLSIAYAYAAIALCSYVLLFPGVIGPQGFGNLGYGFVAWMWIVGHFGFILLLVAYVLVDRRRRAGPSDHAAVRRVRLHVRQYAVIVVAASVVTFGAFFALRGFLPALQDGHTPTPLHDAIVRAFLLAPVAGLFAEIVWRTRLRRSSDLWLSMVVLLTFTELFIGGAVATEPFEFTWYAGWFAAFAAGSIFLAVQMRLVFELLRAFAAHNRSLAEIAQHDALTGLFNRGAFDLRLEALWHQCRRLREPISLLVLDLDFFKSYNDHFGHVRGDEALRRIARELSSTASRPTDLACRIGGEEFAMILPFTDENGAAALAERVILRVREVAIEHAPDLPLSLLTVSVGAATSHGSAVPRQLLFDHADAALYHAKRSGRDRLGTVRPSAQGGRAV